MRLIAGFLLVGLAGCSNGEQQPIPNPPVPKATVTVPAPAEPEPAALKVVMDVRKVVGRSEAEVSTLLGEPTSCADIHRARLCKYSPNEDEVMFVADKADMITVRGMSAVPFSADALHVLGLEPASPDHSDEHAIRWESIHDLEEVTLFPGQGNSVDYAYVKVSKH